MRYGIFENKKVVAEKKAIAFCPSCDTKLIPKCGSINIHHWAHKHKHCDSWHENETKWHRDWKSLFSIENQEVVMFDKQTGEKHIADVRLPNGLVLEFQNSPISVDELLSREAFYKKMIWVVNAAKFQQNLFYLEGGELSWEYFRKTWGNAQMPVFLDLSGFKGYKKSETTYWYQKEDDSIHRFYAGVLDYKNTLLWLKEHTGWRLRCTHYSSTKTYCSYCNRMSYNCLVSKVNKDSFIKKYTSYEQ